ncbi:MAG: glycerol kinase [Gammaproteobacteria bacterium]|jgi:glycerol kinase
MSTTPLLLSIDQGTTSTRAIVFDTDGSAVAVAQEEFTQHFPHPGWVEHDPDEIWATTLSVCHDALAGLDAPIARIGITNQRETTVVWDRKTGEAVYPAIVWQDRRTAERCSALKAAGHEKTVARATGLVLDPYFSATKVSWILDHVDGARVRAERGELAFGTIDCFLIWRLTGGKVHATDATNASRTMLFDIHTQSWDPELLALFRVPAALLPDVYDCVADFGMTAPGILPTSIQIGGVAGDQQAATIGQACFHPGMVKSTYGTGCFTVMNTGDTPVVSKNRLLTTVAYRLEGKPTYALEGSIFIAGAAVQWLRDGLGVIGDAAQTEQLTESLPDNQGVYMVPAFTGLGAPHWDADARGAIFGITRDTGPKHLARAALEAVCYQTRDLVVAMNADAVTPIDTLRVDGGMVGNEWLLQFLSDVLNTVIERPIITETTALGAAYLAGLHAGVFDSTQEIEEKWQRDVRITPTMNSKTRNALLAGWDQAVSKVLTHRS